MIAPPPLTWYVPLPTSAAILCPHTPGTCRRRNHLPSRHEEQLTRRGRTRLLRQRWREGGASEAAATAAADAAASRGGGRLRPRRSSNCCIATFVPSCCTANPATGIAAHSAKPWQATAPATAPSQPPLKSTGAAGVPPLKPSRVAADGATDGAVVAVVKIPPGRANSLDREHSLN